MSLTIRTDGGRSPQDLAHEFEALMRTIAERKRRLPATDAGAVYGGALEDVARSILCCLKTDGRTLVDTDAELGIAEAALDAARAALAASVGEFEALDIMAARIAPREPVPQIVVAGLAQRIPVARTGTTPK